MLDFHSDNPNDDLLRNWLAASVNGEVRSRRFRSAGIDQSIADRVDQPLSRREPRALRPRLVRRGGAELAIKPAQKIDPVRTMLVPAVLMFAMFFVIMTSSPQLVNSVLEEKMSKISEVLLGSVTPFELMMGKLLGNAGVAVVLAVFYLACGYGGRRVLRLCRRRLAQLLVALAVFLLVAILLYGSLYMAVGAACNELKDAQTLMMPVMMVSMFPTFVWVAVFKSPIEPAGRGADAVSAGDTVLDADAHGLAARAPVLASRAVDRAGYPDGPLLRVGRRQDLSHRLAHAGQEPDSSRAGPVGGCKISGSIVRIVLERARQPLEIGAGLDQPHVGQQGCRLDQGVERDIVEVELPRHRDENAVAVVFDQGPVGADAELAAQDDVEGVGKAQPGLVAELQGR